MIIWDETEAQNISTHQLNPKIVTNIKKKYENRAFHFSTIWKIYTFCMAFLTLLPSSIMPKSVQNAFLDGIDKYRCEYSNVTKTIAIINKIIFLILCIWSSIKLKQTSIRHYLSNTISLFIIIPICTIFHLFCVCNENWLNIFSFDTSRNASFICVIIFSLSVLCNHIMMQAQAKKKIVSGVKRGSLMIKKAATVARNSIRRTSASLEMLIGKDFIKKNKIEVDANEHRFSVPEITEDEYDPIMVHSSSRKNDSDNENEDKANDEQQEEGEHEEDDSEKDQDLNSEELLIRQIQDLKREMHANQNEEEDSSNIKDADMKQEEKQKVNIEDNNENNQVEIETSNE